MSRRKTKVTDLMNERDFRHLVELALPSGGCRSQTLEFETFHRERRLSMWGGDAVLPSSLGCRISYG